MEISERETLTVVVWLTHPDVEAFVFGEQHTERLRARFPSVVVVPCTDREAFLAALSEAHLAVVWTFKQAWFDLAPKLRGIVTPSAGRDYFHVTPPSQVQVHYGAFHGVIIAETVVGMLLAVARGILASVWSQESDPWPRQALQVQQRTLYGAHVVILGFGHIGEWIAKRLKPFGVRITGIRRHAGLLPDFFENGDRVVTMAELDDVLPTVDHLVLSLPGGEETDGLLDARRLSLLPSHAWVYNVGRGNAVSEEALARALSRGDLGGACLDVFSTEPLPADSILRRAPNILLMPHASAIASRYMDLFLDELIEVVRGELG